jgi:hypothetical protein
MRALLKTSIASSLAVLTLGVALSASPADAHGVRMGGGFGGFHGGFGGFHGGFGGFHGGFGGLHGGFGGFHGFGHPVAWGGHRHGWWGPGVGFGVIEGTSCIVYQPQYDDAGDYLGQYPVNVCQ